MTSESTMNPNSPPSLNVSQVPSAQYEPAGFFRRFVATVIDGLIVGVAQTVLAIPVNLLLGGDVTGQSLLPIVVNYAISFTMIYFYFGHFYSKRGATPGKALMGLRILRSDTGENMTKVGALGRETIGKGISTIILGIGFLMAIFTQDKRALHDMMFKTRVIRVKE